MKNSWSQMVPKSILLCLPVFLCHSPMAAGAQLASYYGIKRKIWWSAFILLDYHQKISEVSRWSGRNPTEAGCALHWEWEDTIHNNPQQIIPLWISTLLCVVWQWGITGKKQYGWITANKEKENKQPLVAMFSSSVQESWSCSLHY